VPTHVLWLMIAHIRPAIWRRLSLPSATSLATLHDALQVAFGWEDSHLHEFEVGDVRYGVPDPDDEELLDEIEVTLTDVLPRKASHLEYIYDLGDYWTHTISAEHIEEAVVSGGARSLRRRRRAGVIACLDGERAAPPEDCGGPAGYADFLAAISDSAHPRHAELAEWIGGDFDPDRLSLADINRRLSSLR
jgi:Plasmid pRiA4b ORF-3-like protein